MEPIESRLRNLIATIDDLDTRELLEGTNALIEMNVDRDCPGSTSILHARLSPTLRAMRSTSVYAGTYLAECFFPTGYYRQQKNSLYSCPVLCGQESVGCRASGLEGAECCMRREIWLGPLGATNMGRPALWFPSTRGILR